LNFMSAIFMSASIVLFYLLSIRLFKHLISTSLSQLWLIDVSAFIFSLFLGSSYLFWLYGSVAEIFSLHILLTLSILYTLFYWIDQHLDSLNATNDRYLYVSIFLFGLSISNHHTVIFLMPGIIYAIIMAKRKLLTKPFFWLATGALLCAGLSPYIILPIIARSNPILNWGNPETLPALLRVFLRMDYGFLSGSVGSPETITALTIILRIKTYGIHVFTTFWVLLLGVAGFPLLFRKMRWLGIILGLSFILSGPLFLGYLNIPLSQIPGTAVVERFYLLPDLLLFLLLGCGLFQLFTNFPKQTMKYMLPLALGTVTALLCYMIPINYTQANKHPQKLSYDYFVNCIKTLPDNSIFIVNGDGPSFISYYYHFTEQLATDQIIIPKGLLGATWHRETLRELYGNRIIIQTEAGNPSSAFKEFVMNNLAEHRIFSNSNTDKSILDVKLDYLSTGMLYEIIQRDKNIDGNTYVKTNRDLWNSYYTGSVKSTDYYYSPFEKQIMIDYAISHYNQGVIYQQFGLSREADSEYRQAIEINPNLYGAYNNLALLLIGQNAFDEAKRILETGIGLGSKNDSKELESLYSNLALLYEKHYSNPAKSEELWREYNRLNQ